MCISQLEQVFVDDYVLYRPMRPSTGGSEQTAQEGLNRAQDGGQEPLWVKQITSMAESIGEYGLADKFGILLFISLILKICEL